MDLDSPPLPEPRNPRHLTVWQRPVRANARTVRGHTVRLLHVGRWVLYYTTTGGGGGWPAERQGRPAKPRSGVIPERFSRVPKNSCSNSRIVNQTNGSTPTARSTGSFNEEGEAIRAASLTSTCRRTRRPDVLYIGPRNSPYDEFMSSTWARADSNVDTTRVDRFGHKLPCCCTPRTGPARRSARVVTRPSQRAGAATFTRSRNSGAGQARRWPTDQAPYGITSRQRPRVQAGAAPTRLFTS